jgi:hypothetical protein
MKVTQETPTKVFTTVVITLETQDEVDTLAAMVGKFCELSSLYNKLINYRSEKYDNISERLSNYLRKVY